MSVIADLKKFAGGVPTSRVETPHESRTRAKKSRTRATGSASGGARATSRRPRTRPESTPKPAGEPAAPTPAPTPPPVPPPASTPTPALGIADIVRLVPPTLAVRAANASALTCVCHHGHLHDYFVSVIIEKRGFARSDIRCPTCTGGTIFSSFARETFERALGVPFLLTGTRPVEYVAGRVVLRCVETSGDDAVVVGDNGILVTAHKTRSAERLFSVAAQLRAHGIRVETPASVRGRTNRRGGDDASATTGIVSTTIPTGVVSTAIPTAAPLVFSPELAEFTGATNVSRDPKLYFENCRV